MKKLLMLLFVVALAFCLCSCNSGSETSDSLETVEIVEPDYRQIYYDAVQKTFSETRYGYDVSISDLLVYPDGENVVTKNGHVELNGSECTAVLNDGEDTINFSYLDGYIYSDESGGNFKAPMAENEFDDYLDGYIYSAVGAGFTDIVGTENDDGTYSVSLSGMLNIPEALEKHFRELGMSDIVLNNISGTAEIDKNGYITDHTITAELSLRDADEAVKCTYNAEVNYIIGGERAMTRVSADDYVTVDDINTPMLIKNAYENIMGNSYNASYESLYDYVESEKEYSMELNYCQSVTELPASFEASDETVIDYDTVKSGRTVEKSSKYSEGEREITDGNSSDTEEMTDASARSLYYQMLMDYEPDMNLIRNISVKDLGDYYEIEYEYAEENAMLYCQNVLTALVDDQEGIAVHSEDHTIESAAGTMRIHKGSGALITHEIEITANFNDGGKNFTVGFEHVLRVSDAAILEVKNVEAKAGDTVEVKVYLENNPGTAAINTELDFDEDIFTAVSVATTEELLREGFFTSRLYDGDVKAEGLWFDADNFYGNGEVMTFTFEVSENAPSGEYVISFKCYEDDLVNEDVELLEVYYLHGTVTLSE